MRRQAAHAQEVIGREAAGRGITQLGSGAVVDTFYPFRAGAN